MSSEKKDFYEVLGVDKNATDEAIRKAYKKLAIKWHPDKHVDDKKEAEEKFKEISEAYSVLGDPQKRREYDTGGFDFEGFGGFDDFDPFEMFKNIFKRGNHGGFSGFGFDDDDDDWGFGKGFGNFGNFDKEFKMGFDDDDFGFGGNFGGGFGQGTSIKKTTQILNGKKITRPETTTIDSNGNKKTVVKEETGDGQVREYLLGNEGQKIDTNIKQIEGDNEYGESHQSHHHHHGNQKKTTKKKIVKKK